MERDGTCEELLEEADRLLYTGLVFLGFGVGVRAVEEVEHEADSSGHDEGLLDPPLRLFRFPSRVQADDALCGCCAGPSGICVAHVSEAFAEEALMQHDDFVVHRRCM